MKIYSIYDSCAQAFANPFFVPNDGVAIRAFCDNVNHNSESDLHNHYEQFSLYVLGEWDSGTGAISLVTPEVIKTGLEAHIPSEETDLLSEIKALKSLLITQKGN